MAGKDEERGNIEEKLFYATGIQHIRPRRHDLCKERSFNAWQIKHELGLLGSRNFWLFHAHTHGMAANKIGKIDESKSTKRILQKQWQGVCPKSMNFHSHYDYFETAL